MQKKMLFILFGIGFMLHGCLQTTPSLQESAKIIWKSPSLRYADMGFISDNGKKLKIEIYGIGTPLMSLDINSEQVCMSQFECISPQQFNKQELSQYYPDTLLENIFRAKPIYNSENLVKNSNGFTQNIKKANQYAIEYEVSSKHTIFRDKINKILIKVIKI